eukprot:647371-Prorocentrum_minimum.AAC.1
MGHVAVLEELVAVRAVIVSDESVTPADILPVPGGGAGGRPRGGGEGGAARGGGGRSRSNNGGVSETRGGRQRARPPR